MLNRFAKSWLDRIRSFAVIEWLTLATIIGLGISSRLYLEPTWNFKPVAALILFGGFFFRHWMVSAVAMLAIMLLSDFQLGLYEWPIMLATYAALAISAWLGGLIRRNHGTDTKSWIWAIRFGGAALIMSAVFHLLTNVVVWWMWYPRSWQGLLDCFVAAIPFFRPTLESNLLFTAVIIACYAIACRAVVTRPSVNVADSK